MSTLAWLLILLVCAVAAFFAGRYTAPRTGQLKELERQRDDAQAELRSYRENVNTHFEKTARLFNEVTVGYRTLYEHLAEGSERLGRGPDSPLLTNRPEQRQLPEKLDGGSEPDRTVENPAPNQGPVSASAAEQASKADQDSAKSENEAAESTVEVGPEPAATKIDRESLARQVERERMATEAELEEARARTGPEPEPEPAGEQKDTQKPSGAEATAGDKTDPVKMAAEKGRDSSRRSE